MKIDQATSENSPEESKKITMLPNLSALEFNSHFREGTLCFVFMGVTGSGKTTIGKRLAQNSNVHFVDIDELILNYVIKSGLLFESVERFAFGLENQVVKLLIDKTLKDLALPLQQHERQALLNLDHGPLLVSSLDALRSQKPSDLSPLTFLSLSAAGQRTYSHLEDKLTLQSIIEARSPEKNAFTIVSASGSLSTLSGDTLTKVRQSSIFIHFKLDEGGLEASLAQAAKKPMVIEQGKTLRDILLQRELFYQRVSHVSISRKKMWQLNSANDLIVIVSEFLYDEEK